MNTSFITATRYINMNTRQAIFCSKSLFIYGLTSLQLRNIQLKSLSIIIRKIMRYEICIIMFIPHKDKTFRMQFFVKFQGISTYHSNRNSRIQLA